MRDYSEAVKNFSFTELEKAVLEGSLSTGFNACIECCDRWSKDSAVALEWYGASGNRKTVTFAQLRDDSSRFAHYLKSRGIGPGDVVAGLLPRIPDLITVIFGAWRIGALYQPLFTAFGPAAVESRVTAQGGSKAKLIVTDAVLLCAVTVSVSAPSVKLSATMPTLMVAVPLALTVAEPVSRPPVMSTLLKPDRV